MVEITGLDELQNKLRGIQQRAHELDGTHEVKFSDLFPDEFIHRHTQFDNLDAVCAAAGLTGKEGGLTADDFETEEFNQFIIDHSDFTGGWQQMKQEAAAEHIRRQLFG